MSSNTPCAACKFLRRKCTQECVFSPYFPPDDPNKFANVHKVFGASNVSKILNDLPPNQRAEAVRSLAFEAASRIQDPIYGCVATISLLQQKLKHLNIEIDNARRELAQYIGPSALVPMAHQHHHSGMVMQQQQELQQQQQQMLQLQMGNAGSSSSNLRHHSLMMNNVNPMMGLVGPSPQLMIREPQEQQQHQMFDPQQLAAIAAAREQQLAAVREQELIMRNLEHQQQQQHQQELIRFQNHGYDVGDSSGFSSQITVASSGATGVVSPGLTLGGFDESYGHIQPEQQQPQQQQLSQHLHHQMQAHLFLQNQLQQQQQPPPPLQDEEEKPLQLQQLFQQPEDRSGSDEVRRIGGGGGPSC